jgi:hypothetical protein
MLDYLRKFNEQLIASVLDPAAKWILGLSWLKRLVALLVILGGIALWQHPAVVQDFASYSGRLVRVARADPTRLPLEKKLLKRINAARTRLLAANINDANLVGSGGLTGWSAAQVLLAVAQPGPRSAEEDSLITYVRATRLSGCSCWPELNDEDERHAWTFVSGWVMAALAEKKAASTEQELAFLLQQQNTSGSWSSIPKLGPGPYESVYTTSWAVMGLVMQLDAGLVADAKLAAQARRAVQRGAAWLLSKRGANARWKPYPHLASSSISGSISGLALHTLHLAVPDLAADVDQAWLDNLPASAVPASLGENYYVEIKQSSTRQIDHFVQLTMPWMLIATVDAYPNGNLLQKARALSWVERTLGHESVKNADAEQENWWRGELLIALNHLVRHVENDVTSR